MWWLEKRGIGGMGMEEVGVVVRMGHRVFGWRDGGEEGGREVGREGGREAGRQGDREAGRQGDEQTDR